MANNETPDMIQFSSIYGFKSRDPEIHFEWGDKKATISVTEARAHAIAVLETVEAAIGDAFMFEFAGEHLTKEGVTQEEKDRIGAGLLNEFRKWRYDRGFGGGVDPTDPRPKGAGNA